MSSPNETSALLKNQSTYSLDCNHNNTGAGVNRNGYHAVDDHNHIVYVSKDSSEYESIFSLNDYSSLTLDELLPYKLDPWWQNLRRILFLTFWLTLVMTFITACFMSYVKAGTTTCNIVSTNGVVMPTSSSNSDLMATTTTTLPTTIAKVLSTELLGDKFSGPVVP